MLNAIVAIANNNVIGKNNELPWKLPNDLKRFQQLTFGKTIIMGRNTFNSIGALPYRNSIVLTHENIPCKVEGVNFTNTSNNKVIGISTTVTFINNLNNIADYIFTDKEYFVIGGAQIYKLLLPYVQKLYVTQIYEDFDGDTFFPDINKKEWILDSIEEGIKDSHNKYDYEYKIYLKKYNEKLCKINQLYADKYCLDCWQACNLTCPN